MEARLILISVHANPAGSPQPLRASRAAGSRCGGCGRNGARDIGKKQNGEGRRGGERTRRRTARRTFHRERPSGVALCHIQPPPTTVAGTATPSRRTPSVSSLHSNNRHRSVLWMVVAMVAVVPMVTVVRGRSEGGLTEGEFRPAEAHLDRLGLSKGRRGILSLPLLPARPHLRHPTSPASAHRAELQPLATPVEARGNPESEHHACMCTCLYVHVRVWRGVAMVTHLRHGGEAPLAGAGSRPIAPHPCVCLSKDQSYEANSLSVDNVQWLGILLFKYFR